MTMIRQHLAALRSSMERTESDCCQAADCRQGRDCPNRHPADERADAAASFIVYVLVGLLAFMCVASVVFA